LNLGKFYKLIVEEGIKHDPRSKLKVLEYLKSVRQEYNKLPYPEKKAFDKEKLSNPYSDSRILFGSLKKE